ncbi:hypothetical protein PVAP13_8NG323220 [Panicum virgatum]|uniref:Uncharacterized protein n=1 Tax=Panicum virgatum TaxID=38727 RepID=A0A8T0PDV4_PANVG|nr:hypothetical protein PVAP13_8NG323220 [Panicum virgatum]
MTAAHPPRAERYTPSRCHRGLLQCHRPLSVATAPPAARRDPWLAGAPLRASLGSSHDGLDRLKHACREATAAATVTMACPLSSSPSPSPSPSPISDQSPPQLFPGLYLTLMRS